METIIPSLIRLGTNSPDRPAYVCMIDIPTYVCMFFMRATFRGPSTAETTTTTTINTRERARGRLLIGSSARDQRTRNDTRSCCRHTRDSGLSKHSAREVAHLARKCRRQQQKNQQQQQQQQQHSIERIRQPASRYVHMIYHACSI